MESSPDWNTIGIGVAGAFLWLFDKLTARRKAAKEKAEKEKSIAATIAASGLEVFMAVDKQVKHVETRLAFASKPIRTFVIHFHNGTFTDAGLSLLKMTIQHEITSSYEVYPLHKIYYGVQIPDFLMYLLRYITLKEVNYIEDREELLEKNQPFYDWLTNYDILSMYSVAIKSNKTGKIVAILCLQYDRVSPLTAHQIMDIKEQKKRIEQEYDKLEPKQY